jgi:hypothetical protein
MPDADALRAIWPATGSLEDKLAIINGMTQPGPITDIPMVAIRERLAEHLAHLEVFAMAAKTRDIRRRLNMAGVPQSVTSAVYLLQLLSSGDQVLGKHRLGVLRMMSLRCRRRPYRGRARTGSVSRLTCSRPLRPGFPEMRSNK